MSVPASRSPPFLLDRVTDIVDTATRSRMMSGIRDRNTKPEIVVRSMLHRQGFRFRLHVRELPGKPDIVLPRHRAVIFVNGCFWHGHDCHLFKWPKTRVDFWRKKIERNRENDNKARVVLLANGWRVAVVWECAIKGSGAKLDEVAKSLAAWVSGSEPTMEQRE